MEIILAKTAGFCFGVKRAVDMAENALDEHTKVYSFGRIVHNNNVNDKLKEKGLIFTDDINEIEKGSNVIIRAHGITKEELLLCKEKELNIVNTTCPNVARIHDIVSEYSEKGYDIIIIGDELHPEVLGIKSRAQKVFVINEINQTEKIETIQLTDMSGKILDYYVYDTFIVEPDDTSCTSQLTEGKTELTLITCTATGKQRFVVKTRANV